MVSRLTPLKRADLLLRALAAPDGRGIRAVIAGEGEERPAMERLVSELGLEDRVTLAGGVTEAQLLDHLARCRVVCFPPLQEDYGFVAVEAFASRKPVVTCADSGGPAELVADGERGYVCSPTPEALAQALRRSMDDRASAERMGAQALAYVSTMTWAAAVETLTR
jgi:glycosyltransferase involved in cell wall biosynthesis